MNADEYIKRMRLDDPTYGNAPLRRRLIREAREMTDEARAADWAAAKAYNAKERNFIILALLAAGPFVAFAVASLAWLVLVLPPLQLHGGTGDWRWDFAAVLAVFGTSSFAAYLALDALANWFWRK